MPRQKVSIETALSDKTKVRLENRWNIFFFVFTLELTIDANCLLLNFLFWKRSFAVVWCMWWLVLWIQTLSKFKQQHVFGSRRRRRSRRRRKRKLGEKWLKIWKGWEMFSIFLTFFFSNSKFVIRNLLCSLQWGFLSLWALSKVNSIKFILFDPLVVWFYKPI